MGFPRLLDGDGARRPAAAAGLSLSGSGVFFPCKGRHDIFTTHRRARREKDRLRTFQFESRDMRESALTAAIDWQQIKAVCAGLRGRAKSVTIVFLFAS